jgi:hypothetical protein
MAMTAFVLLSSAMAIPVLVVWQATTKRNKKEGGESCSPFPSIHHCQEDKSMKNLIDLYKSFCTSVGIVADNEGFMSTLLPGSDTPKPWIIESKRAVLPLPNQLAQPDWSGRIGFHPLLQNVAAGDSRVMEKFRDRMNGYADFELGMLLVDIANLAVKKNLHQDLSPAQAAYLGPFSDADEKFVKLLTDLLSTKRVTKKNAEFVRFSVIKGRQWQGQKRSRVAVMHLPLYELLPKDNKPTTILSHKLRISDVKMLRSMYEFLFTGLRELNHYEVGSDSKIAPSMESLMSAYGIFAEAVNKAVTVLEPVIGSSTALYIVDDWRNDLDNIEQLLPEIRKIPLLEGNAASERVAAVNAPAMISDQVKAPIRTIAAADATPTLTASAGAQIQHQQVQQVQQGAQQVQTNDQANSAPRFKLGSRGPTVNSVNSAHQISDAVASQVTTQPYQPLKPTTTLAPTPEVGSLLAAQQPVQQVGMHPQQQFAGNVLGAQAMQAVPQAMKVPESARLINGQLYIPLESNGVAAMPAGAILCEGRPYIPLNAAMGAAPAVGVGMGVPGQQRFGQQAVSDPAQIPGLTEQEILYYRANPVMFANFLQQMHMTSATAAAATMAARTNAVPRYLQTAIQTAQQQQAQATGFYRR